MFTNKLYSIGFFAACLLISHVSNGQSADAESGNISTAVSGISRRYSEAIGNNSRLYNGPEYVYYNKLYRNNQGDQFFKNAEEQKGEVVYDGFRFTDVSMLYDTHLDQVVITTPTSPIKLRLVSEKLQSFSIHGHNFVRVVTDPAAKLPVSTGFYDLLLDDKFQLLAKREKEMKKKAEGKAVYLIFLESSNYFILKDGIYYPASGASSFAKLFPDQKADIQKYARSNKLKFNSKNKETSILKLAQYSASLLK